MKGLFRSFNDKDGKYYYFYMGRYYSDAECKKCVSERICSEFDWNKAIHWSGDNTGHFDEKGEWVLETQTAKIRNKLTPLWTLVDLLLIKKRFPEKDIAENVERVLEVCNDNRNKIVVHLRNIDEGIK